MIQIYGTIGPNCRTQDIFESMLHEGMNGIRLNLSHGSLQLNSSVIRAYADACRTLHVPQCIMIDLHGPEQRVGVLEQPIVLQPGDYVKLQLEDYIPVSYEDHRCFLLLPLRSAQRNHHRV